MDKIRLCAVPQEIGSHSFSHAIFGDPGCSRETARSELAACVRLAREMGIEMCSFAFPRNQVGHLDVVRDFGFTCYLGRETYWYLRRGWPKVIERLEHLWHNFHRSNAARRATGSHRQRFMEHPRLHDLFRNAWFTQVCANVSPRQTRDQGPGRRRQA
jgi:hypothetical protein